MTSDIPAKRPKPKKRTSRARRIVRGILLGFAALVVVAILGFLVWANTGVMQAEAGPLAAVRADSAVSIRDTDSAVVMSPTGEASGIGLVFIPGAKVDPNAYLNKLAGAVEQDGLTVVITKPILNLAFFDQRPLSTFTDQAPGVSTWFVGGHSLGGVRACQYAAQPDVRGLILFGSYCANDLSKTSLEVLSLSGSSDGLSTPEKIQQAKPLLPANTRFVEIPGGNHARFGDYGLQPGDGTATVSSADVRAIITNNISELLATKP